ncbi:hypothetical protein ABZV77_10390 [Streptomyces sp. NPDC004732]|uniref:hypothetical protein n=1 Tax=Streptomyces sp. NPDC004732 TaxID=3154290 RepID=UPI0033BCFF89
MANRGRILKVTAALTLSSLALTGFTTGRGHGGGSRHGGGGGGGGGCSNSSQDHDSSSSSSSSGSSGSGSSGSTTSGSGYDDDDDMYGSSGGSTDGGSGGTRRRLPNDRSTASSSPEGDGRTEDGKAKLVRCATEAAPYATVKVTNNNAKAGRFWVSVTFVDAKGLTIIEQSEKVKVPGKGKATARVEIGGGGLVDSLDHCEVDPQALPVSS